MDAKGFGQPSQLLTSAHSMQEISLAEVSSVSTSAWVARQVAGLRQAVLSCGEGSVGDRAGWLQGLPGFGCAQGSHVALEPVPAFNRSGVAMVYILMLSHLHHPRHVMFKTLAPRGTLRRVGCDPSGLHG